MRRFAFAATLATALLAWFVPDAAGQPMPAPLPAAESQEGWLAGYRFYLNVARLAPADEPFSWDANIGSDMDIVDYGAGRLNLLANYNAVMGNELQAFDPNQGNYTFDIWGTVRLGTRTEVGAMFHHVSRHLGDREKRSRIDWNMIGVQAVHRRKRGKLIIDALGWLLGATKRSGVDYRHELVGRVDLQYPLKPRVTAIGTGSFALVGVVRDVLDRGTQTAGRVEGGLRLTSDGANLDLFVAVDRRIDADPLQPGTRTWALFGFRVASK